MLKAVRELISLLTQRQRKQLMVLQLLVIIMAIMEIVGVIAIVPFMALVGDPSLIQTNTLLSRAYAITGVSDTKAFLILVGGMVLAALTFSAVIAMFTTWRLSMFGTKVGTELADRLYQYYLHQSWLFHASGSSAQLTKKVANETERVTKFVILPLMHINAKLVLIVFMSLAIFLYDPKVAIIGLSIFMIAYLALYKIVRAKLHRNGQNISRVLASRFSLLNEGFGGIKDILLLGRQQDLEERFRKTGEILAYSQGTNTALGQVPRYLMELVAFGAMIAMVLYLLVSEDGKLGAILPILSVYALAGMKLLPALQQVYSQMSSVKGNLPAFESIREDLIKSHAEVSPTSSSGEKIPPLKQSITFKDVIFTYPGKTQPALDNINLVISANTTIGIVGPSGSGKSTLIDVILGLISPDEGELFIDNQAVGEKTIRSWQDKIGFVSQSIFLSDSSIAQNVAFGLAVEKIDIEKVRQAITLAHLDELLKSLEHGLDTQVGERGVQLSGGQRQRIGIARALYHDAEILIFDEATSALDGITERMIMQAIDEFSGSKTIIMIAHRLKTIERCDEIFFIDHGKLIQKGTYQQLLESNEDFARMARHA